MPKVSGGSLAAHRAEHLERIYDSFRTLLVARGYDAVTLAEVAEHAGMARTAIYNYVPDKESLLVACTAQETAAFLAQLDEALRTVDHPVEQLRTFVRLLATYVADSHLPPGSALRLLVSEATAAEVAGHVAHLEARLAQILRVGRDRRFFDLEDVDASTAMITACVSRGATAEGDRAAAIATTEAFVLRAVGARLGPDGRARKHPRR